MISLKSLFNRKSTWEQNSFTNIVSSGERIVVFCPEDSYKTSTLLSHILSWKDHFKQISIILPDYDHPFFKRIHQNETTTYFNVNTGVKPFNNAVIFNFNSSKKIRKVLDHCRNSTILDISNPANLQFIPTPNDPVDLLKKFADFFDFTWERYPFDIEILKSELMVAKHQLIKNRFKNFILDFSNEISGKMLEKIVQLIKHEFSANIYFTGKRIHDKDFINIEEIQVTNLMELYSLAKVSNLLITDRMEIAGTFADIDVDQIFVGKNFGCRALKCVEQNNITGMKIIIQDILNK